MSVFYFDSLGSYCVCFFYFLFFIYSALVANKGLIKASVRPILINLCVCCTTNPNPRLLQTTPASL